MPCMGRGPLIPPASTMVRVPSPPSRIGCGRPLHPFLRPLCPGCSPPPGAAAPGDPESCARPPTADRGRRPPRGACGADRRDGELHGPDRDERRRRGEQGNPAL
eukprot:5838374-Prymnesium_polylepis.1